MTRPEKLTPRVCSPGRRRGENILWSNQRMNSVPVNAGGRQFRCRPFVNSDRSQPFAYDFILNQPGQPANYQPVTERVDLETAWREFNEQGEVMIWLTIASMWIAFTGIGMGFGCMSLDGTPIKTASSSCATAMSMNARCRLKNSRINSRGWYER